MEPLKTCIDASAFQLGAVISHKVQPIAFYSIKLTGAQQQYIVTDKELYTKHCRNLEVVYKYITWSKIKNIY